ncbi:MAG TPA: VWA domain-containing protein [Blastocatellia bacterium]|nr:VWA domain-containing protein [Blastocatellia bacterium]
MKRVANGTALLITLVSFGVHPQQQSQSEEPIRLSTELVVVDAQVLSKKSGLAVGGLGKGDFTVYEDGVKQVITHFSQDVLPLSVVILLDVTSSVAPVQRELREGAVEALRHLKPRDDVALMEFAAHARVVQSFTWDRQSIADGIQRANAQGLGNGTFINEAIYQAADYLGRASSPSTRRVIIAVTDDVSTQRLPLVPSETTVLGELYKSGSTVAGLIFDTPEKSAQAISTGQLSRSVLDQPLGLVAGYANQTGGVSLTFNRGDLREKFGQLLDRLRSRYTIGYIPSNARRDGRFRKVKITVSPEAEQRLGKIAVKTRKGYYAR